jgi:PAS domain S-box-containing protein
MSVQQTKNHNWARATLVTCAAIMLLALVVLVGWHAHIRAAVQVFHGLVAMQYNTALCFLALGAGGIGVATRRRWLMVCGGSFIAVTGGMVILEYATGVSFGIDTLFFYPWERSLSADPGRMALTTAISFFLSGGVLIVLAVRDSAYAIFGIVNSIPLSLALTSLVGYSFGITYVLPFRLGSQMALHTSVAFLAYGIAMLAHAWQHAERGPDGLPKWTAGIGTVFLPVLLVSASAMFPKQSWRVVTFETLVSVLGVALITLAVLKLSRAKVAYKGLLMIGIPLILLLIFVGLIVRLKNQSDSAQLLALRSREVLDVSESLMEQLAEAESAVRGYIITNDERFLISYAESREAVTRTAKQLRHLAENNPSQARRAIKIEQLTAERVDYLNRNVEFIKAGHRDQVEQVVKGMKGTNQMQQVRDEVGLFSQEEDRLEAERHQVLDSSWQKLSWLLVAGTAAAILLASILTLLFSGSISRRLRQLQENAISLAVGNELASPLTGHDEIAELDRVFHEMAESLGEVTRREKAVIDGTTDAIFVKDLQHRYLMMNRAGAEAIGLPLGEIIGNSNFELVEADSAARILVQDKQILATGRTFTYEFISSNLAGVARTYWTTRGPYHDAHGNIVGTLGISRDITDQKKAEQALAISEKRYRALVENGQGLICTHDLDGRLLSVNPAGAQSLGYTPDEMVGRLLQEFIAPALHKSFSHYLRLIQSAPFVSGLLNLQSKQGSERIWMYRNTLVPEPGGAAYVLGFAQDVTDSKRVEEESRMQTQRLSLATQVGNIGVWDWDIATNSIDWDERMFDIYGLAPGSTIDYDHWRATVVAEDLPAAAAALQAAITRKSQEVSEFRILRPDGSLRHVQAAQGVVLDREGKVVRVIGLNLDITERKLVELALKENDLQLVEAQHIALMGSWSWDIATNTTQWSEALYHIYGLLPDDCPATVEGYLSLVHPDDREYVSSVVQRALQTCQGFSYNHRIVRPDNSVRFHQLNLRVAVDEGGRPVKLFGTAQDVTDRVKLEEDLREARDAALESVRLKSEFLANMSHEIRTPMNGVIGMTGLLLETDLTGPQREYTETIESSAEALLIIVNDILDFSKIEAGMLRLEKIDFELRSSVEAPVEVLAGRAQAKGLELASLVYRDVPTALRGDPGRLRQVLTNLVGNAVKFTEAGEVVVSVTRISETSSHAVLRFEIQDTGIGISEDAQQRLFLAFTQADGSTTRKYGGTGLGLAISKQLIELMGGEIGIESTLGVGSTFWFTLRFEKQLSPAAVSDQMSGDLFGIRVLIVDDNATNRKILMHQTGSWGMIPSEAGSAEQALALLLQAATADEPYDIAILDLTMPKTDGFQLAEAIKSDPVIARVTLVLLPSFGRRGHGETALQVGIAAYLQKPVRQSLLHDCLTAVMTHPERIDALQPARLVTEHSIRELEVKEREKTMAKLRIIIAEDNLVNQKVALRQLYNLGYHAEAVANGRQLLKVMEGAEFDLILMDCQMPEMDGFDATAEIRRREGANRHTIIIAMTANALDGDEGKCLEAGMDDYLSKPVKADALRLKLERWTKSNVGEYQLGEGGDPDQLATSNVIDQAQLQSLREVQGPAAADFVTELIDLFLADASQHLKALRVALTKHDAFEIERLAHRLKGSSASIGATRMSALFAELEGKESFQAAEGVMVRLESEFELVREALKAERKEM